MSSPMIPSPFIYGDIPAGGQFAPQIIAARQPSNTIDKQYSAGYLWLSSLDMYYLNAQNVRVYGDGSLWYQAGNSSGSPNWIEISASTPIVSVLGTANQITANNVAGTVTLSTPATFIAPGSIASTTTLTATLGNITATNGNLVLGTAGNKLQIAVGTNGSVGVTPAMTTGAVTVSSTAVTANSIILYSVVTPGGSLGTYTLTKSAGVSFTITSSSATETSTFNYLIIN